MENNLVQFPSDFIIKERDTDDTSIYQYRKGYGLQPDPIARKISQQEIKDELLEDVSLGRLGIIEEEILRALYLFKWLNKKNLELYLNNLSRIPQKIKKPNYRENINKLRDRGAIVTFRRKPVFAGEETELVVYRLSEGAYNYINMYSGLKKTYEKEKDDNYIDTAKALEILSLNQWYIAVCSSGITNKTIYRYKYKKDGSYTLIEAAAVFDVDKEKYGEKKLALYALALPKKEEWATDMLNRLLYLNRFLQSPESPYPASLIVIVCESATRMKDAYATIKSIKELDQFNLLFTLDEDVIRGNGIDKLYSCKYNAKTKGVTYTTTSLKLFDKKKPATE